MICMNLLHRRSAKWALFWALTSAAARKIVGLHENGTVIAGVAREGDTRSPLSTARFGNFLATHSLKLTDIGHIALTGVGASCVDSDIYGVRTIKVEEFPSVGVGGLALSRKERAVVVSMGTGTSPFGPEKGGEIRHHRQRHRRRHARASASSSSCTSTRSCKPVGRRPPRSTSPSAICPGKLCQDGEPPRSTSPSANLVKGHEVAGTCGTNTVLTGATAATFGLHSLTAWSTSSPSHRLTA